MNSCNFLVHSASGSSVKQSDLEILEAKLESLIFEVSTLKKKVILLIVKFLCEMIEFPLKNRLLVLLIVTEYPRLYITKTNLNFITCSVFVNVDMSINDTIFFIFFNSTEMTSNKLVQRLAKTLMIIVVFANCFQLLKQFNLAMRMVIIEVAAKLQIKQHSVKIATCYLTSCNFNTISCMLTLLLKI